MTSFKADSTKVGSTVNPTQTTAFSATVMANVTFPPSHTTQIVTSSIESLSSPYLPPTKAETKTKWLNQSMVQPTNWIPFSSSKTFSELSISSYHKTRISTSSSTQSSEVARSKLIASSASYSKSASQTPYKISSSSIAVSSHRQTPQKRSSAVSKSPKLTPSLRSSMTTLPDKSKWQSSSVAVSATSSRIKVSSQIIVSTFILCTVKGGAEGAIFAIDFRDDLGISGFTDLLGSRYRY